MRERKKGRKEGKKEGKVEGRERRRDGKRERKKSFGGENFFFLAVFMAYGSFWAKA